MPLFPQAGNGDEADHAHGEEPDHARLQQVSLREGKRADLIVVKKNPLKKIGRLRNLAGVMVNGVWLSEDDLADRLAELAARWTE